MTTRYLDRAPRRSDRLRLFCFHHAGGGASAFTGWRRVLGPDIAVYPVQLPGREGRVTERPIRHLAELVGELDAQLDPYLRGPFAFYGHSMGALVAYALTRRRFAGGRSLPDVLLAGAYPGPHRNDPLDTVSGHSDQALVDLMAEIGGITDTVRRFPRLAGAAVELFRADLAVCDSYLPAAEPPLPVPIHVFTGSADPLMSTVDAESWARHTSAGCQVHVLPGGHFFTRDCRELLLSLLESVLRAPSLIHEGALHRGH